VVHRKVVWAVVRGLLLGFVVVVVRVCLVNFCEVYVFCFFV